MISHPFFLQKIRNMRYASLAKLANNLLSIGGISYYLHNAEYRTRVILFNYFSLLANEDFSADWIIEFYSPSGSKVVSRRGSFNGQELAVVDTEELGLQSPYGLVIAHIKGRDGARIVDKVYDSVFFTEHYARDGVHHDIAHSLRWPTPVRHSYEISGHGFSFLPNAKPYVLIGNSYKRMFNIPRFYSHPSVEAVNSQGKIKRANLPPIPALGCYKVDLIEHIPDVREHFGGEAGMIRVRGENIVRKPFFYQSNGHTIASDHL